jgi:hypothetical protein
MGESQGNQRFATAFEIENRRRLRSCHTHSQVSRNKEPRQNKLTVFFVGQALRGGPRSELPVNALCTKCAPTGDRGADSCIVSDCLLVAYIDTT